jgi:hypothetical protein
MPRMLSPCSRSAWICCNSSRRCRERVFRMACSVGDRLAGRLGRETLFVSRARLRTSGEPVGRAIPSRHWRSRSMTRSSLSRRLDSKWKRRGGACGSQESQSVRLWQAVGSGGSWCVRRRSRCWRTRSRNAPSGPISWRLDGCGARWRCVTCGGVLHRVGAGEAVRVGRHAG